MIPTENIETKRIDGRNVVLLPYTPDLVPIYHGWMQDPALLTATASEPLSIQDEYANQISWAQDPTKYCLIIHSRRPVDKTFQPNRKGVKTNVGVDHTLESESVGEEMKRPIVTGDEADDDDDHRDGGEEGEDVDALLDRIQEAQNAPTAASPSPSSSSAPPLPTDSNPPSASSDASSTSTDTDVDPYPLTPIGDVNLFLYPDFNLGDYGISGGGCEIEVMIAEESYRRRGLGLEAVQLIMNFSAIELGVERFVVKILASNTASIELFEKKLKFRIVEYVECFDEVVLFKDTSIEDEGEEDDSNSINNVDGGVTTVGYDVSDSPSPRASVGDEESQAMAASIERLHIESTRATNNEESSTRSIKDLD